MRQPIAVTLRRQFVWLFLVLLSVGAARVLAGQYLTGVQDRQLRGLDEARQANQRMLQDLTDIDTAVLRYQLTGDPVFLELFRAGSSDYPAARSAALRSAPDDRTRVLVRDQDQAAQRWLAQVALPISAQPAGRPGSGADRSARGKELFDAIRAANAAVTTAVEDAHKAAMTAYRRTGHALEAALALSSLAPVLIAVRIHRCVRQLLAPPAAPPRAPLDAMPADGPLGEPPDGTGDDPPGGGADANTTTGAAPAGRADLRADSLPDHVRR